MVDTGDPARETPSEFIFLSHGEPLKPLEWRSSRNLFTF